MLKQFNSNLLVTEVTKHSTQLL